MMYSIKACYHLKMSTLKIAYMKFAIAVTFAMGFSMFLFVVICSVDTPIFITIIEASSLLMGNIYFCSTAYKSLQREVLLLFISSKEKVSPSYPPY